MRKITNEDLDNLITDEQYYVFPGTTVTICCLTLSNGFNVIGDSATLDKLNFDKTIGEKIARHEAREKLWQLEGYRIKSEMSKTNA